MNLQRFRERHPGWARFLHLRAATSQEKFRSHARALMSLGSMGMLGVARYALLLGFAVSTAGRASGEPFLQFAGIGNEELARVAPGVVVTGVLLLASSAFVCFVVVRMLGKSLMADAQPSVPVAIRLRWLGHLLSLNLFASLLLPAGMGLLAGRLGFGFNAGFIASLIGISVCYALAATIREGARAADENRGFV